MHFIDVLGSCLVIFEIICGLLLTLRPLLPHNIIPLLSALLNEMQQLLDRAEAHGSIPLESEYRIQLDRSANRFARIRTEGSNACGVYEQLRLAVQCGHACRVYALYYRVKVLKSRLELTVDEQQKRRPTTGITESVATPSPAADSATPTHSVVIPILLPLPITARR